MAKDPAVLFYTSDFLSGTSFFTDEQKGQYITLLCQQHQLGRIPKNHMINICKSYDSPVINKFVIDDEGFYYNIRMREEAEKRRSYCISRSNNKSGRTKRKSYENHMENENENINVINKELKNIYTDQIQEIFDYFCLKTKKTLKLNDERKTTIKKALERGHTVDQMKVAIDNFCQDEWEERHKFSDLVYAIGTRNKIDNVEKWLYFKPKDNGNRAKEIYQPL